MILDLREISDALIQSGWGDQSELFLLGTIWEQQAGLTAVARPYGATRALWIQQGRV